VSGGGRSGWLSAALGPGPCHAERVERARSRSRQHPARSQPALALAVVVQATASTQVSYVLSEAGSVVLTVERKAPGRRVAGTCKPLTRKNKAEKPCDRWIRVGSFTAAGNAGPNVFTLPGRIGGKALTPGAYRLTVAATDTSKNASPVSQSRFTIVR